MSMKALILAGGSGTRLYPVTVVINKHFLPIYNKPMIYYPLSLVMLAGIREVLFVVNPEDLETFKRLFGRGEQIGMSIDYRVQDSPKGLADGLRLAEGFVEGESLCMMLGDNIFFGHELVNIMKEARQEIEQKGGAYLFGYYVNDPKRFGIVEFDEEGRVVSLEEKPEEPKSNYAVTGMYFYDSHAIEIAKRIKPSWRGELEITSVNEEYLKQGNLKVKLLGRGFAWFDTGTHHSFLEASSFIETIENKTGLMIGCIEEIAYRNGWIDRKTLLKAAQRLDKTDYGVYLRKVAEGEIF